MSKYSKWDDVGCLGWCVILIGVLVLVAGLVWLDVFLATLMWGAVAVPLFNLPMLTMWQVFCVKVLLWLLVPVRIITTKK